MRRVIKGEMLMSSEWHGLRSKHAIVVVQIRGALYDRAMKAAGGEGCPLSRIKGVSTSVANPGEEELRDAAVVGKRNQKYR